MGGVLVPQGENDPEQRAWVSAFVTRLEELGWKPGENIQLDYRWAAGDAARMPVLAKEIIELKPDVIFAATVTAAVAFRQYTLIIPIVFTQVADPVAAGLVTNLARPEGNVTGFTVYEHSISGKWIEALRECVPDLARAAILFDPGSLPWAGYMRSVEAAARPLGVQLIPFPVQSDADIEQAFARFATEAKLGAIVLPTASTLRHRKKSFRWRSNNPFLLQSSDWLIALAAQHRIPAVYNTGEFVAGGGLISYGASIQLAQEMRRIRRRCRKIVWLNPLIILIETRNRMI